MNFNIDVLISIFDWISLSDLLTFSVANSSLREVTKSRRLHSLTLTDISTVEFFLTHFPTQDYHFVKNLRWLLDGKVNDVSQYSFELFSRVFSFLHPHISAITVRKRLVNHLLFEISYHSASISELTIFGDLGFWQGFSDKVKNLSLPAFNSVYVSASGTDSLLLFNLLANKLCPKILLLSPSAALSLADSGQLDKLDLTSLNLQFRKRDELIIHDDRWDQIWDFVNRKSVILTLNPIKINPLYPFGFEPSGSEYFPYKVKTNRGSVVCVELPVCRRDQSFELDRFYKIVSLIHPSIHFALQLTTLSIKKGIHIFEQLEEAKRTIEFSASRIAVLELKNTDIHCGAQILDGLSNTVASNISQLNYRVLVKNRNLRFKDSEIENVEASVKRLVPRFQNIVSVNYEMDSDSEISSKKLVDFLGCFSENLNTQFKHLNISSLRVPINTSALISIPTTVKFLYLTSVWTTDHIEKVLKAL
ncbi:hypothetical protein HK096_009816, partial [Nowakowskiella sp. JEL0078]